MASEERFGYEWHTYSELTPEYEEQFKGWSAPLTKEDWKGKDFLDAGCGMGRNSFWPLLYGARSAVALDNDDRSLSAARTTLQKFSNVTYVKGDMEKLDLNNEFDIVFSIGVIHHLADPLRGLKNLVETLRPGGRLLVWVYSYEGNEWIVHIVNPVRKHITSKMPLALLRFLSYGASVPLYLFIKITGGHTPYLRQLSKYKFWHLHSIVFDQLLPEVAYYWKQSDVEAFGKELPLSSFSVEAPKNNMGWILTGIK
jgi:SAM-dependent methyltransferase